MISENEQFSLNASVSAFLQIREALGMSRKKFAQELGINEDTVGKWERSKSNVQLTISQIKRLDVHLAKLGLTWQDLPDHVGDPAVPPPKDTRRTQS
jgi:transcriptional regulator with XRE-family HTH domain